MGFKHTVKDTVSKSVSFQKWASVDQIKSNAVIVGRILGKVFKFYGTPGKATQERETFEESVARYELSEADLQRKMKELLRVVIFCLGLSLATIFMACFQFSNGHTVAGLTCLMLTLVLWAQAFREHFNYFQIKQRRLGCTIKEWFVCTIKAKGSK